MQLPWASYLSNVKSLWLSAIEEPLPKVQRIDTEQVKDDERLKQATDKAAVLQDELIQAADRERQLQIQLDKMKADVSRLKKDCDNFQQEREMMHRDSAFNCLH